MRVLNRTAAKAAALAAALGAAVALSACGGGPPKARVEDQQREAAFAARGYAPAGEAVTVQPFLWRMRGDDVHLSLATPAGPAPGPRPVVLYLPGLGEAETAGLRWRRTWAAAGYAVLSLQPLDDDATAWSSELARSAEFTELGRRHYAEAQLRRRVARLDELLAEAQRLGRAGESPWRGLDWSRTVVAGYELGAQMAMALAGERQADGLVLALKSVQPVAAIVISPQVFVAPDPARDAARYGSVSIPVLGLTGPDDSDVLGLVRDLRWRPGPFAAMPAGLGWLLDANEVRHAAFGGNEPRPEDTEREEKRIRDSEARAQAQAQAQEQVRRAYRGIPMRMAPVPAVPDYRQLHQQQLGVIASRQVSVAFLDVQLKRSEAARAWLAGPAQAWIGQIGTLRVGR